LGKTHLLHAIGNRIKHENAHAKICYVHAMDYISDVIHAVRTNDLDAFKQFYNSLDLLLIDDIQFIADKPATQQEFSHTLTSLVCKHKQVVITCDTLPKEISGMTPRLISRFDEGLIAAVEPPDIEARVSILKQKAQSSNNPISEEVAFFIAKHVQSNIRELEGALRRVDAYSRFYNCPITVESCKEALKDLLYTPAMETSPLVPVLSDLFIFFLEMGEQKVNATNMIKNKLRPIRAGLDMAFEESDEIQEEILQVLSKYLATSLDDLRNG
jgi:chromosomal replication initiator protein